MVLTVFRNTKIVTADQKNNLPTLFKVVYLFLNPIVAAIFPIGVLGLIPSTTVLSVRFERIEFRKTRIAIPLILTRGGQKLNGRLNAVQKSQIRSRSFNIPFNPFNR